MTLAAIAKPKATPRPLWNGAVIRCGKSSARQQRAAHGERLGTELAGQDPGQRRGHQEADGLNGTRKMPAHGGVWL